MITTLSEFQSQYHVKDGEIASELVLSRPVDRLKSEINETATKVSILMGDSSAVDAWVSGTYEKGAIVSYNGITWESDDDDNTGTPGVSGWKDLSALTEVFSNIASGSGEIGAPEILEYADVASFPAIGESAKIYISLDDDSMYRWNGSGYALLSASGGSGGSVTSAVLGLEDFMAASEGQTVFNSSMDLSNGVMVFVEGILLDASQYTVDAIAGTVTLLTGVTLGSVVKIGATVDPTFYSNGLTPATRSTYTATEGQTSFSHSYVAGNVDVYRNGLKLTTSEFTATDGLSVILSVAASLGDIIEIISYSGSLRDASSSTGEIDCSIGEYFYIAPSTPVTLSFIGVPGAGYAYKCVVEVTDAGSNLTFPASVKWAGGVAPTLSTLGVDLLEFRTRDGGVTWYANTIGIGY